MKTATRSQAKATDAIALLKADHKKVKDLFSQFEESEEESEQKQIVEEVIKELKIHSVIEEEIFYPAVRAALEGEDEEDTEIMDEADEEHRVAKTILEELENEEDASDEGHYCAKVMVLAENIRHHIQEEENEMFKKARSADVDLKALGEQMMQRKEELMSSDSELEAAVGKSEVKPYQELN